VPNEIYEVDKFVFSASIFVTEGTMAPSHQGAPSMGLTVVLREAGLIREKFEGFKWSLVVAM